MTFNTINNNTTDASEGYQDFTCNQSTDLTVGQAMTLSVSTGTNAEEVRAWIDYNNDGAFTSGELVMASNNTFTHSTSVIAPSTALTNVPLRMRVGSESDLNPVPDGCSDLVQGQYEDYAVVIYPDTTPPAAAMQHDVLWECQGEVSFTDLSTNGPSTWLWDFGDANSSSAQHPTHTYAVAGTYNVQLTVCNAFGCNSTSATVVITGVSPTENAACYPQTTSSSSFGYGITNVAIASINHTTADGSEGYRDFSCTESTQLIEGQQYQLEVTTSIGNNENARAWIDYNNDGAFTSDELILTSDNTLQTHIATVTVPVTAVMNTPLRMRVGSDDAAQPEPDGCSDVLYGQYEDYAVTIVADTLPPAAGFLFSQDNNCSPEVIFFDISENDPSSWLWDFGDNTTSTMQNPVHTYAEPGIYTVTFTATNAFGSDQTTQQVTINIINAGISYSGTLEQGNPIDFESQSPGAISWSWNFGDNNTANTEDATHTYADTGVYTVTLVAVNGLGCADTTTQELVIGANNIGGPIANILFTVQPNPTNGPLVLRYESATPQNLEIFVHNSIGQVVQTFSQEHTAALEQRLNLYEHGSGVYYIRLKAGNNYLVKRVVVH